MFSPGLLGWDWERGDAPWWVCCDAETQGLGARCEQAESCGGSEVQPMDTDPPAPPSASSQAPVEDLVPEWWTSHPLDTVLQPLDFRPTVR
jgi:hypothetical protein